jgi:hypothetical protein
LHSSDRPVRKTAATEEDLASLHRRLLDEQPTAPQALVNACSGRLFAILKRRFALVPREEVQDAVHDALLALIARPSLYDPARGSLMNLLVHIGCKKLIDQLRKIERRSAEIAAGGTVELAELEAKHLHEHGCAGMGPEPVPPEVEALLAEILPEARDRAIWELVLQGRTPVEEFVAVLGLGHLPSEEMKAEVKRQRDRVIKKVQRRREEFRRYLL